MTFLRIISSIVCVIAFPRAITLVHLILIVILSAAFSTGLHAESRDLGAGFTDHGVVAPISNDRGVVATVDGRGHNVLLSWINDHRGCYELLLIDTEAKKAEEHPLPFPPGDHPFASILSSANKFYTHFNSRFVEFDPATRTYTFSAKTTPQMAMGMAEDDQGIIWSATYPSSGLVSFNPKTREFKDYGSLYKQNWSQYPRSVVADDAGWVYVGIGSTRRQILAFNPESKSASPLVAEADRKHGYATLHRGRDGKVYANSDTGRGRNDRWLMLHKGVIAEAQKPSGFASPKYITGSQALFHATFPDGKRVVSYSLADRLIAVHDPKTRQTNAFSFDYKSEGAHIMGVAAAPDGTICGGTAFPMRFFSYNPRGDAAINRDAYGQWNTVERAGDRFFVGGYGGGFLLEWTPARAWVATAKGKPTSNPLWLTESEPTINRPHELLALPDSRTVVLAGTPGYGYTGGGLLFWDRILRKATILEHTDILPQLSTLSLAALPGGKLLGGTTTNPGTGGEKKAKQAELYIMDIANKKVEWHSAIFPGAQGYADLYAASNKLVYGFADLKRFFVFDPKTRTVVHQQDITSSFGRFISHQGTRAFITDGNGGVYILFGKCIARLNSETHQISAVATSPVAIGGGGDYLNGRIYFFSGSHLYSYTLEKKTTVVSAKP